MDVPVCALMVRLCVCFQIGIFNSSSRKTHFSKPKQTERTTETARESKNILQMRRDVQNVPNVIISNGI